MAAETHNLAIFRGLLKFKSNQQKIWGVLIFLSIVTTVEVALGIIKPEVLMTSFLRMKLLNWIFIILTIVKAYYIAWDFMHVRDEKKRFEKCNCFAFDYFNTLSRIYSFAGSRLYI